MLTILEEQLAADIVEQGFDRSFAVDTANRLLQLDVTQLTLNARGASAALGVSTSVTRRYKENGHLVPLIEHRDPDTDWVTDLAYLKARTRILAWQWECNPPYPLGPRRWEAPSESELRDWLASRGIGSPEPGS